MWSELQRKKSLNQGREVALPLDLKKLLQVFLDLLCEKISMRFFLRNNLVELGISFLEVYDLHNLSVSNGDHTNSGVYFCRIECAS